MKKEDIILVGGGGHCKSVIDVAESAGYSILGILERPEEVGKEIFGYPILGTDDDMAQYADKAFFLVTVGQIKSPSLRIKLHQMIESANGQLATVVSPTAHVSKHAIIDAGTVVMHHAVVNAGAQIGKSCIINTFANVEHDVVVGNYCHLSTGSIVNGNAHLGEGIFIGSQSVVNQGVCIGNHIVVASSSLVNENLTEEGVYAGVPVRKVK
jgi:sugar O-acyltransferase (sialic acid O-acetyltransferase NeuD family)